MPLRWTIDHPNQFVLGYAKLFDATPTEPVYGDVMRMAAQRSTRNTDFMSSPTAGCYEADTPGRSIDGGLDVQLLRNGGSCRDPDGDGIGDRLAARRLHRHRLMTARTAPQR